MSHITKTDPCEMPSPSLPAASLRPHIRLPARRVLPRTANYLIRLVLSSIRAAILRAESNFLPALRERAAADAGSVDRERMSGRGRGGDAFGPECRRHRDIARRGGYLRSFGHVRADPVQSLRGRKP